MSFISPSILTLPISGKKINMPASEMHWLVMLPNQTNLIALYSNSVPRALQNTGATLPAEKLVASVRIDIDVETRMESLQVQNLTDTPIAVEAAKLLNVVKLQTLLSGKFLSRNMLAASISSSVTSHNLQLAMIKEMAEKGMDSAIIAQLVALAQQQVNQLLQSEPIELPASEREFEAVQFEIDTIPTITVESVPVTVEPIIKPAHQSRKKTAPQS